MNIKNKGIIRRLTWRSVKANRFRNLMAVVAIALTAIMFTAIATMGGAIKQSMEESTFRQVGSTSHGGYKLLSQQQYDAICETGQFKDISYDIILGFATNEELAKKSHEVRYAESKMAEWSFCKPTVGNLPQQGKEIALSTITLDMLSLPHTLGQTIHLEFLVDGVPHADDFTLVGIWPGDKVSMAVQCYLSKDYVRALAPDPGELVGWEHVAGGINASILFDNANNVEAKLETLATAAGLDFSSLNSGINWGYMSSGELEMSTLMLLAGFIFIIMLSGYLIIYSIFAISVSGDIQFYGLLKTIGTTGRQIKRIVRGQALMLSGIGIPIGLLLGFYAGSALAPTLMGIMNYELTSKIQINPALFAISGLFSLITVFLSCRKPGKVAASVSPIEALRYTESAGAGKKKHKARKVTPFSMAWSNVSRSKRKLVTVLLSLSLSLVLLNSVVSVVNGFDMDSYIKDQAIADIYMTDASLQGFATLPENRNYEGIADELIDEVKALPGLETYGRVFYRNYTHTFASDSEFERFEAIVSQYAFGESDKAALATAIENKEGILKLYGVDQLGFEALRENYQNIDWEKLNSGNYLLISSFTSANDESQAFYKIGDTVYLTGDDGVTQSYEVLGLMEYPYILSAQMNYFVDSNVVLSAENFEKMFPQQPMGVMLNVDDAHADASEQWVEKLTNGRMSEYSYSSKAMYVEEFESMQRTYLMLGGSLAFILAMIGVLNFINTMATSIMTRKRELAMLQSVGMTGAQLKQMLFFEGLWYAILTLAITLTLGSGVSALLIQGIAGQMWFFRYTFSLLPMLASAPVLIAICALVPLVCAKLLQKESIVERLREN